MPFSAFFGPVYGLRGDSKALRREWTWTVSLGMMAVCTLLLAVLLTRFGSRTLSDFNLLDFPVLFWTGMAAVMVARWMMSAIWLFRRRASLRRIETPLGLDARLAAAHGPASVDQVRWHARIFSALALFFLVPALAMMDTYPWIFGPMALMFVAQAWAAFRVYQMRVRRERVCASLERSP